MELSGTAISLSAAILGAFQGQVGSLIHKWLDYKYKIKELKSKTYLEDKQNARNATGKRFLITRRILAVMIITTFCAIHILPGLVYVPAYIFYSESNGFLSSIFYGGSSIRIEKVMGFLLSPDFSYMVGLIGTLYFGINNGD
jgi:hypothetical protein